MKKCIVMLLALSTLHMHHCNGMETTPTELVKEIVRFSIINNPNYTEARTVLLSVVQVCKQWRDTIEKEYDSIITMLAQQEQKKPVCIAALMGTPRSADWLQKFLDTIKNLENTDEIDLLLHDLCTILPSKRGSWVDKQSRLITNMPDISPLPLGTRTIMQQFFDHRGFCDEVSGAIAMRDNRSASFVPW